MPPRQQPFLAVLKHLGQQNDLPGMVPVVLGDVQQQAEDTNRLDEILEKIDREGIQSLSSGEKAFLKRASKR